MRDLSLANFVEDQNIKDMKVMEKIRSEIDAKHLNLRAMSNMNVFVSRCCCACYILEFLKRQTNYICIKDTVMLTKVVTLYTKQ